MQTRIGMRHWPILWVTVSCLLVLAILYHLRVLPNATTSVRNIEQDKSYHVVDPQQPEQDTHISYGNIPVDMPPKAQETEYDEQEFSEETDLKHDATKEADLTKSDKEFQSFMKSTEKWVHLDLKGAPPTMDYLKLFLPHLQTWGATGVLLEYEDMFPYEADLKILRAKNCYTKNEVTQILNILERNDMKAIPLVQTLGHMEFVLKHANFASLRENSNYTEVLNPGHNNTMKLLTMMIDQVVALHPGSSHLHIGADEVFVMGQSSAAKKLMSKHNLTSKDELYLHHIKRLSQYIKGKYPKLEILIWDDMMREMDFKMIQKSQISSYVTPVVWQYQADVFNGRKIFLEKYSKVFDAVYLASAFKGASGNSQYMPNLNLHVHNHDSWLKMIRWLWNSHKNFKIGGLVLTGWSRYDHFSALCDLLPASIPSLVLCLEQVKNGRFSKDVMTKASKILLCPEQKPLFVMNPSPDILVDYRFGDLPRTCSFPGHAVFYTMTAYHRKMQEFRRQFDPVTGRTLGHCNRFSLGHAFLSVSRVQNLCLNLARKMSTSFDKVQEKINNTFSQVYQDDVRVEWLEEHLIPFQAWLKEYDQRLRQAASVNHVWGQRPDQHVEKTGTKPGHAMLPGLK